MIVHMLVIAQNKKVLQVITDCPILQTVLIL